MLIDRNHQIAGTYTVEQTVRPRRPVFLVRSAEDFRCVVSGACGLAGGRFCHLIPVQDGELTENWSAYIRRLCPDVAYLPASLTDLKPKLEALITGLVIEREYAGPVTWGGSPYLHSLLAERNADGSPAACGPIWLVDTELLTEPPPVSELQRIARFGLVPEFPNTGAPFLRVQRQLHQLVHTVPPAPGQGLVEWLLEVPRPDRAVPSPPYLAGGGSIHSPVTLTHTRVWAEGQSFPPHHRDSSLSLVNSLVVVGNGDSLEDACLFWNLRANRSAGLLPTWVTPAQAELPEIASAIATAARHMSTALGAATSESNRLHLVSATMDTRELADSMADGQPIGTTPADWIHFFDRRYRTYFRRSKEAVTFADGRAAFFLSHDSLPCPPPTQVTLDVEIESFRPPPIRMPLGGTNGPHIGRFGQSVIPLNDWFVTGSALEADLGYPRTFEFLRHACEEIGLRPSFDRKAALTYGLNRILGDDYGAHMILRSPLVIGALRLMVQSERTSSETERQTAPRGTSFGELHRELGSQPLARGLLSWLLRNDLAFRGLELECAECGTRAWYSLNDVGNRYQCVGCQGEQSFDRMPDGASWRYRVNQLLASALDQGIVQQVLTAYDLGSLRFDGSRSYVFPNVTLQDTATGNDVVEFDLLGFLNGEWIGVECKSSDTATAAELGKLRQILDRLRGGLLVLVRASTAEETSDHLADQVLIWDREPIRQEPVDSDDLLRYLEPG